MDKDLLNDLIEYFENKADADGDSEGIYPNKEMQLLTRIRDETPSQEVVSKNDMDAKEFYNGLFNLDFMTEEEKETIYKATELFAKGKVNQYKKSLL